MPTQFHTNLDAAKHRVRDLGIWTETTMNVGDQVLVARSNVREVFLTVVGRKWISNVLHVELNLPANNVFKTIAEFEKLMDGV